MKWIELARWLNKYAIDQCEVVSLAIPKGSDEVVVTVKIRINTFQTIKQAKIRDIHAPQRPTLDERQLSQGDPST